MVVRRVGSGTFVTYRGPLQSQTGEVADFISPLQLIDARFAIEPHMARLAALHATGRDLERLADVLLRLENAGGDKEVLSVPATTPRTFGAAAATRRWISAALTDPSIATKTT